MDRLLTSAAAADRLAICRKTLTRMESRGKIQSVQITPGRKHFRASDVDRLIRGRNHA